MIDASLETHTQVVSQKPTPEYEKGRQQIVKEILSTERTYHKNLVTIIKVEHRNNLKLTNLKLWMTPLKDGNIIDTKFLPKIFSNVESIIPGLLLDEAPFTSLHFTVTARLLIDLDGVVSNDSQTIGDVFLSVVFPTF